MRVRSGLAGIVILAGVAAACGGGGGSPAGPSPAPVPTPAPTPAPTARYSVTFDATWSAVSHPEEIPPDPHFSRLVGGTHAEAVSFWAPGEIASDGIEAMAERGSTAQLAQEVEAAIAAGQAERVLLGGNIPLSPGSTAFEFEVSREFPLVTLVSMLAPSPDWFVGVHGMSLLEAGDWTRERVVTLFAYDAGTDSGVSYQSRDRDTRPREAIARIAGRPLAFNGSVAPVGTYTFRRLP